MPTGDAFKEMQMIDLLHSTGMAQNSALAGFIPPRNSPFGMSLSDNMKDRIQYMLMSKGNRMTPEENRLLHLIGDPPSMKDMGRLGMRYGGPGAPMG